MSLEVFFSKKLSGSAYQLKGKKKNIYIYVCKMCLDNYEKLQTAAAVTTRI